MHLHLSTSDGAPIYLQIMQQIKSLIAAGRLAPGEELPPIRALAEQLVVKPNTVARAYRELAGAGVLANRRTAGTYVADGAGPVARADCRDALTDRIDNLLAEARLLNVSEDDLIELVRRRAQATRKAKEKHHE
jgi:GntR family transcriptional regulator